MTKFVIVPTAAIFGIKIKRKGATHKDNYDFKSKVVQFKTLCLFIY